MSAASLLAPLILLLVSPGFWSLQLSLMVFTCCISCYTRDPILFPFTDASPVPTSCSSAAHTSSPESRDQWSKSPVSVITTDWTVMNMWFKLGQSDSVIWGFRTGTWRSDEILKLRSDVQLSYGVICEPHTCQGRKGHVHEGGKDEADVSIEWGGERGRSRESFFTSHWLQLLAPIP